MSPPAGDSPTPAAPPAPALLRHLPAVDRLKGHPALADLDLTPAAAATVCRSVVAEVRAAIAAGALTDADAIRAAVDTAVHAHRQVVLGPSLRRVLNGTGVLLHTNAGRAPLPTGALQAIARTAGGYCNLELSLDTGRRGSRQDHLRPLLQWLTGAEDALVVNNGAAAVLLALAALCHGRRVLVSRGELVEIGGGFRIPEVLATAGCELVEVGTTNRTHLRDYARWLEQPADDGPPVAAILQVHRSNFAVVGFTAQPELADLAALAHRHGVPLVVDLGSGALAPLPAGVAAAIDGASPDPTLQQVLAAGADVVTCSGDKLLGGPQAGVVLGRSELVAAMAKHPLARALRIDNLVVAALEHVLRVHLRGRATRELPALRSLAMAESDVEAAAEALATRLRPMVANAWQVGVEPADARPGGGSDPLLRVASRCLVFTSRHASGPQSAAHLLRAPVPVLGRVRGDQVLLDVRSLLASVPDGDLDALVDDLGQALGSRAGDA